MKLIPLNKLLYNATPLYKDSKNRLCIKTKNLRSLIEFIKFNVSETALIKFISSIHAINTNQHGITIKLNFVIN